MSLRNKGDGEMPNCLHTNMRTRVLFHSTTLKHGMLTRICKSIDEMGGDKWFPGAHWLTVQTVRCTFTEKPVSRKKWRTVEQDTLHWLTFHFHVYHTHNNNNNRKLEYKDLAILSKMVLGKPIRGQVYLYPSWKTTGFFLTYSWNTQSLHSSSA